MMLTDKSREARSLRVVKAYRRQMDFYEDETNQRLVQAFRIARKSIFEELDRMERSRVPLDHEYNYTGRVKILGSLINMILKADDEMDDLINHAARLGVACGDDSAKYVKRTHETRYKRINTAGLFTGVSASAKKLLHKLPETAADAIGDAVRTAKSLADKAGSYVREQAERILASAWSDLQRVIRTTAERVFRRAITEMLKRAGITKVRRMANHSTACLACLMLEGTVYDTASDFSDHPNGRCYLVPVGKDAQDDYTGRKWLQEQDEETQKQILGKTRWEAWQNGDISLDDLAELQHTEEFGDIPHAKTLAELGLEKLK